MEKVNVCGFLMLHNTMAMFTTVKSLGGPLWAESLLGTRKIPGWHKDKIISDNDRKKFQESFAHYEEKCRELGLAASVATLRKIRHQLEKPKCVYGDLWGFGDELQDRLLDEMAGTFFFALSAKEAEHYANSMSAWGDVSTKFPTEAVYEIDEAAKCIALGRSTATVFHLMRTMEIGIRSVARCLQIPDPIAPQDRSWGKILEKIRTGIQAKWSTAQSRQSGDGAFFDAAYASLDAVKNPWRNATMHVEKKYTQEEAEEIYNAVRAFMRKLASRLDENGLPHA